MQSLAQSGYTAAQIDAVLHGPVVTWAFRYELLDLNNKFKANLNKIKSCTVKNNAEADIKRTASFSLTDDGTINFLQDRIKPYAQLKMPDNGWAEWALGVFLLTTTPINIDATYALSRDVGAYDLLKIIIDDKVADRYVVAAGANYITTISSILTGAGLTQQNLLPSTLTLPAVMEWAPGTTKLQIINDLLGAINYKSLWMDENGIACATSYISPMDRPSEYTYSDDAQGIFFPEMVDTLDLSDVPNKWVLVVSESNRPPLVATYENHNAQSLTSYENRGNRYIVDFRTNNQAADQATLNSLILRIATEASQIFEHVDFDTGPMPIHSNDDVFTLNYSRLGLSAKFKEVSWEFTLQSGAKMKHTIRRVVYI